MTSESNFVNGSDLVDDLLQNSEQARAAFERRSDAYEGIELLRDLQARSGKSRRAIAESMGVKPSRVTQVLRGDAREGPSYAFIKRFARACGFDWPALYAQSVEETEHAEAPGTISLEISRHETEAEGNEPELRVTLSGPAMRNAGSVEAFLAQHEDALSQAGSIETFLMTLIDALLEADTENPVPAAAASGAQPEPAGTAGPETAGKEGTDRPIKRRLGAMTVNALRTEPGGRQHDVRLVSHPYSGPPAGGQPTTRDI
jgi:transcriptional regulator with XRE-family HTH domain